MPYAGAFDSAIIRQPLRTMKKRVADGGERAPTAFADGSAAAAIGKVHSPDTTGRGIDKATWPVDGLSLPQQMRRMQAKLLTRGTAALADDELLEMLLAFVVKRVDAIPLASTLINRFGSPGNVLSASARQLLETPGVELAVVAAIKVVQASAELLLRAEVDSRPVLNNWGRLLDYLNATMARLPTEQFRVLFLDNRNRLIQDEAQLGGTVDHVPVYPREVMKRALELHATALILVHNHPSGDPTPSADDIDMTAQLQRAASTLSIKLHDHIIVGSGKCFFFTQEGLL